MCVAFQNLRLVIPRVHAGGVGPLQYGTFLACMCRLLAGYRDALLPRITVPFRIFALVPSNLCVAEPVVSRARFCTPTLQTRC